MEEFQPLADRGDGDAQFMVGYLYASGKGVPQDYVRAHLWFNLASAQGSDRAIDAREKIAEVMTPQQIAEAQKLAREWQPGGPPVKETAKDAGSPGVNALTGTTLLLEIQEKLAALGYEPGPADGKMGARTRSAIRDYQGQAGLPVDGEPSQALLKHLQEKGQRRPEKGTIKKASASPAQDTPQRIKEVPEPQTQEVIDRLKAILREGETENRADGHFLAELHALVARYDWPWRTRLFLDDFQDGDLTRNPAWTIVSGDFWVDSDNRLVSRFTSPESSTETTSHRQEEDTGTRLFKTILGEILKEKGEESAHPVKSLKAEIYTPARISNPFSMEIELLVPANGKDAGLDFGPYRGREREAGYRLIYVGGRTPTIQLARQSSRGSSVIDRSPPVPPLHDGRPHSIRWQRYSDGGMVVALDGKVIIRSVDRTFRDAFDGISIVNHNGEYAFPRIEVFGTNP
jgi:hypothetical protein